MGLIFWGCRRKLVEQFLAREHDGSQTRTCVTGSRGEVCPLGIDVSGRARKGENLISCVAAPPRSFANAPVIVGARPRDGPRRETGRRPSGGAQGGLGGLVVQGAAGDGANMVCARVLTGALVSGTGRKEKERERKGKERCDIIN